MKKTNKRTGSNKVANQITPKQFLETYDPENEFTSFYEGLNPIDQQGLESAFEAIEHELPLNNGHVLRYDRAREPYVFADVKYKQGNHEIKIPVFGKIQKFIKDYQMGKVNIDFTIEDLFSEAASEEAESVES